MENRQVLIKGEIVEMSPADHDAMPREFRNAWVHNDRSVEVDMDEARAIWRNYIRRARRPELEKLDIAFMQALEKKTATTAIANKKQALRDATADPRIDAAKTPEELSQVMPCGLVLPPPPEL